MPDEIISIKEDLASVKGDIEDIKDALLGNEFNKGHGFVKRLTDLEKSVKDIQEGALRNKWLLIGLAAGSGVGGASIIEKIITAVFK